MHPTKAKCALLLVALMVVRMTDARSLRGDAIAVSTSDGGTAISSSDAKNQATVKTTAVGLQGGTAVASQTASEGTHEVTTVAIGNDTATVEHHDIPDKSKATHSKGKSDTWETAPSCPFPPTASNSVKDKVGRRWGWANNKSCAFRTAEYDLWDTAPACPPNTPTVKDKSGRDWGWANNASCAAKAPKTESAARRALLGSAIAQSIAVATQETQTPTMAVSKAVALGNSDAQAVSEALDGQAFSEALAAGNSQATAVSQAIGGTAVSQAIAGIEDVDSLANTAGVDLLDHEQLTSALCCMCDKAAPTAKALAQAIATGGGCGSSAGVALARAAAGCTEAQAQAMAEALANRDDARQCITPQQPSPSPKAVSSPSPSPSPRPTPSSSPDIKMEVTGTPDELTARKILDDL